MTVLFIILGILFLVFLPIIEIYFPFVFGRTPNIPTSENENYDLNPNKRGIDETKEDYDARIRILNLNTKDKDQLTFKGLIKSLIIASLAFIIGAVFYFHTG